MKKKNDLKIFMESVPYAEYSDMKWSIINACSINDTIWSNWLKNKTIIPPLAKEKINEFAGRNIFVSPELELECEQLDKKQIAS